MQTDYLVIGQGISGTWLSYYLEQAGASFLVMDNADPGAPSRLAAGIINPVTGRRHVAVWLDNILWSFVPEAYRQLGNQLRVNAISQRDIIDFFPTPQMRLSFSERVAEQAAYMRLGTDEYKFLSHFNYDLGFGCISPVYTAHLETILPAWRKHLQEKARLLEEDFDHRLLQLSDGEVRYKDITAGTIIFCDGAGASRLPWFERLPFAPNKGEALTLHIPDLPTGNIYKKGMMLTPLAQPGQWWIGSGYAWDFENLDPTPEFRVKTEALLKEWLNLPFTVTGHLAGDRPATLERRPFVGRHPLHPQIAILNGMGTKGCSLAPYFAWQLAAHLLHEAPIHPDADVQRFKRILSRGV